MHIDRGRFLFTDCTQSIQEEMLRFIGEITDEATFWDIFKSFHKLALLRKFYNLTCCAIGNEDVIIVGIYAMGCLKLARIIPLSSPGKLPPAPNTIFFFYRHHEIAVGITMGYIYRPFQVGYI